MRPEESVSMRGSLEAASTPALLLRAQQGDEAAFRTLYEIHGKRVYSICLRMVRGHEKAERLTQRVFVSVFRNIGIFRESQELARQMDRMAVRLATHERGAPAVANHSADALGPQSNPALKVCASRR